MTTCTSLGLADALARLAHHRDPHAWARILDLSGDECWRCCLAVCGHAALADDAFQETLLQVRDKAHQFRVRSDDGDGDARRWLKRVASTISLQLCRSRIRAEHRDRRAGMLAPTCVTDDPCACLAQHEDLTALRESLADLDEPWRSAITLHHVQGQTLAEVAVEMGRPIGTVKIWIHRGLEALHTRLASRGVAVSMTSLVALFTCVRASAATAVMPATVVDTASTLLTTKTIASLNAITLTTPGTLPMAIEIGLLIALTATAITLSAVSGQDPGRDQTVAEPAAPATVPPDTTVGVDGTCIMRRLPDGTIACGGGDFGFR